MPKGIPVKELDQETRQKLGVPTHLEEDEVDRRLVILGNVLRALRGITNRDALWVLQQARGYVEGENADLLVDFSSKAVEAELPYSPPASWVIHVVAREFEMRPAELKRRDRSKDVVLARHVAMYILWKTTRYTLGEIGEALGGRSPATVGNGFQRIAEKLGKEPTLNEKVSQIIGRLQIPV